MEKENTVSDVRERRVRSYLNTPDDIIEHHGTEGEVAQNYRGRLAYELLQNADDAMEDPTSMNDRVCFKVSRDGVMVANTGRPINGSDLRALCGMGLSSATTKAATSRRRATIGHKGMGFKSVLELTNRPEVHSTDQSFRFDAATTRATLGQHPELAAVLQRNRIPVMRLPFNVDAIPDPVSEALKRGYRTAFWLPYRRADADMIRAQLKSSLSALDARTVLFLRNLEEVEIDLDDGSPRHWSLKRFRRSDDGSWIQTGSIPSRGVVRVDLQEGDKPVAHYLLLIERDLEIGRHRAGLDERSWAGVELSEIAIAVRTDENGHALPIHHDPRLHVFLPTRERSPFPFLVNGAFSCDLSRTAIKTTDGEQNYNSFLLSRVGRLVSHELWPWMSSRGQSARELLALLNRAQVLDERGERAKSDSDAARRLIDHTRTNLAHLPFVPINPDSSVPLTAVAVPPSPRGAPPELPVQLRHVAASSPAAPAMPTAELCEPWALAVLRDLGTQQLSIPELLDALESVHLPLVADLAGYHHDPVLDLLVTMWQHSTHDERCALEAGVRSRALFPVGRDDESSIPTRVRRGDNEACFLPPRGVHVDVPLHGIHFLAHALCWGSLSPTTRNDILGDWLTAVKALWGAEDFRFDTLMRAAVLPRLTLDRGASEEPLRDLGVLAAICQMSTDRVKPERPLVHERLGANRALFRLCRLPVPCRNPGGDEPKWVPAWRAYFGEDWLVAGSVEALLKEVRIEQDGLDVDYILGPAELGPALERYETDSNHSAQQAEGTDDEADDDLDTEIPLDAPVVERWRSFLTWLGVNTHMRPVGLLDPEDKGSWTSTADLQLAWPRGGCLARYTDEAYKALRDSLKREVARAAIKFDARYRIYYYRVYDLDLLAALCEVIRRDPGGPTATALLAHLALWWHRLEPLARIDIATPQTTQPWSRSKPPRAYEHEVHTVGEAPWVRRLRRRAWAPTSLGPRRPSLCWLPTPEFRRRFVIRRSSDALLPQLDLPSHVPVGRMEKLARFFGMRADLNPSTFQPEDCLALYRGLAERFSDGVDRRSVREIIQPAYRHAFELMPPAADERATDQSEVWRAAKAQLSEAPLLATVRSRSPEFLPAQQVHHVGRRDTLLRLDPALELPIFVLEGHPGALAPLRAFFGIQALEVRLTGRIDAGECPLDDDGLRTARKGLMDLAPYLLCRLEADRANERQMRQDARRMLASVDGLEPVGDLLVAQEIGEGSDKVSSKPRPVDHHWSEGTTDRPARLLVTWTEQAWPPEPPTADALAAGLCSALGVNAYESFLALLQAESPARRKALLLRAGAPDDLDKAKARLEPSSRESEDSRNTAENPEASEGTLEPPEPTSPEGADAGDDDIVSNETEGAGNTGYSTAVVRPLWALDALEISDSEFPMEGTGIEDANARSGKGDHQRGTDDEGDGLTRNKRPLRVKFRTDLDQLDALGMALTMQYELRRSRRGFPMAEAFDAHEQGTWVNARIVDVSTPARVAEARCCVPLVESVFRAIEQHKALDIDPAWPGFDILSLVQIDEGADPLLAIDRMIELKSSGVRARVQGMTWNEWKTAREGVLSDRFWLYLVGNLRSDLHQAEPFIQTIRDPFASLRSRIVDRRDSKRVVQIDTSSFKHAVVVPISANRSSSGT